MPAKPAVDTVPPLGQRVALVGPLGLTDRPAPLLAELGLQLVDFAEHLVHLLTLVLREHLSVRPQALPCGGEVDQRLGGVVLFERPPRQPSTSRMNDFGESSRNRLGYIHFGCYRENQTI